MKRVFVLLLAMSALLVPVTKSVKAETISTDNKVAYSYYNYYDDYDYNNNYKSYNNYDYDDYYDTDEDIETFLAVFTIGFFAVYLCFMGLLYLLLLAVVIYTIVLYWKLFEKCGRPGWAALIPVYNNWVFFEIAGLPGWLALLGLAALIPFANILAVFAIYAIQVVSYFYLAKKFNKEWWFGLITTLCPVVGLSILVFDKNSQYDFTNSDGEVVKDVKYKKVNKCSNCGEPLEKGDEFCTKCGTKKKDK